MAKRRRLPHVVLDTNLVLSALIFGGGTPRALRHGWQQEHFQPLVSKPTVAELVCALGYPRFKLSATEQEELLADYLPWCETIHIPEPPPKTPACSDPFDQPFLQLAVTGKADFLVTGDSDLLALTAKFSGPIVTAARFFETLGSKG